MGTNERKQHDVEPFERGLSIPARGATLGAHIYEPRGEVRGNVLVIGAVAVPQRFYAPFARFLAQHGLRVLTYDYRGVGTSRPSTLRGYDVTLSQWAEEDYPAALAWLLEQHGGLPTVAVGHSLGGQVVALPPQASTLRGVLTVASQSGYAGNFDEPWRMQVLWRVWLPTVIAAFGYAPGWAGTGEDLPRGVAEQWARWCLSPRYFLDEHPEYAGPIARFDKPMLAYSFSDDDYAPLVNVRWLHAQYAAARIEHRHVDPRELGLAQVGHFGFFRTSTSGLWPEALSFLSACLEGRAPLVTSFRHTPIARPKRKPRITLTDNEVLRDLEYGRV